MAEGVGGVKRLWAAQQRRFALWSPVMIGMGVWLRLGSGWAISLPVMLSVLPVAVIAFVHCRRRGTSAGVYAAMAIILVVAGYAAASVRVHSVQAPILESGFRGAVEGRVIQTDRSRSDAPRIVLDRLSLAGVHPSAVPQRVRITLVDALDTPKVGATVSVNAVLSPPSGPAAPGGFDFSRQAFFKRIGGVGYARGAVDIGGAARTGFGALGLNRLRADIAQTLRERIGGEEGAVAAALIVGDRSGISDETTEALRDSGLAHLLAISGLHIGLMSALTFWLVRFALALMPVFASRVPIRKIAAVAGLVAAGGYLALAGFGVATQRAFVMAAVAFAAILLDRPAVTARGLAAAACLVLILRPESLFEAGFQMSFAAVAALVAGYEATRPFWKRRAEPAGVFHRMGTGFLATLATSLIAGAATAPFAAYHFNRLVAYGLPANVLATPVMGLWIMPAIILTAVLAPFGLAGVGLAVLGWGVAYVLWVAEAVAGLDGAAWSVMAGPPLALALVVFGGLWLVIWRGPLRMFALLPLVFGLLLWRGAVPPSVYIAEDAKLIAGTTKSGLVWVSREKTSGYSAETWLRRHGQSVTTQLDAYERRRWRCDRAQCSGETGESTPVVLLRTRSVSRLRKACASGAIVVAPRLFGTPNEDIECILIDRTILDGASSVAITVRAGQPPLIEVAARTSLGDIQ